ncbi:MAG: Gfo/Idh/MocA family protein [Coraliomargaritaceae bacterium]
MSPHQVTRRNFLKSSIGVASAIGFPTLIPASALGKNGAVAPSNRVNIGVIGCGQRSMSCWGYKNYAKSEIVAVCDPFLERRKERAKAWGVEAHYNDFRDLLAREDVDAVSISTPDHWHVPLSIAAARAGKDVYCEKPLGLSIEQNLAAREITQKHKRVFQYGTQQRSMDACRMGLELVLNRHIGDIREVHVWAPGTRAGGNATETPVPEGFDYDLWLGPAPKAPYCEDRVANTGGWWIYDYSIGFIGGWGAHPLDILQWWADESGLGIPEEYQTTGTIPKKGLYDTATNWQMKATYKNGLPMYFMDTHSARNSNANIPEGLKECVQEVGDGTFFQGSKGWVSISRGVFKASSEEIRRKAKDPGPIRLPFSQAHMGNFVDSILTREQPVSNLDSAIRSDIISHMGDLCIRTGETLRWDPKEETIIGSNDAMSWMHRPMRSPWTL